MKLDQRTILVLKNFSSINPSIVVKPGNVLTTMSPSKTILAKAKVNQEFEDFAIYDLSKFLGTLSLFNDPELTFNEKNVTISQDKRKVNYTYAASLDNIVSPPSKEIKLPEPEVEFDLLGETLQDALKALSVLSLPELAFIGDGKTVTLQTIDSKSPSADNYSVDVGETTNTFKMIFRAENIKMLPGNYKVQLSSKGLSKFSGNDIDYFVAIESNSTFLND
jgi:hypothetical protein